MDAEALKRDLQALARLDPEKAFGVQRRRKSLVDAITETVKNFFGLDADVAKAGRKISAARLKIIKDAITNARAAADLLEGLVAEVEAEPETESFTEQMRTKGGTEEMTDQIKAAVADALKSVGERLDQITARLDAVEKVVNKAADDVDVEVVKSAVAEAIKPLQEKLHGLDERLKAVERMTTKSRQPDPDEDGRNKRKSEDPFGDAVRERREPVAPRYPGIRTSVRT